MILSDRDIKVLCKQPEYVLYEASDNNPWRYFWEDDDLPNLTAKDSLFRFKKEESFIPMIEPFIPHQVKVRPTKDDPSKVENIVSYGLSSAGYDVRLDRQFKIFTNINNALIDPLNIKDDYYVDHEGDYCIIPPNSYVLGLTMETFHIPRDIVVIALGKSTYARLGCAVNVTPVEPGWNGRIVVEVANQSPIPVKIHAGMGIAQFMFNRLSSPCEVSYEDRKGKYQGQNSLQTALV